eukprot:gene11591-4817_t
MGSDTEADHPARRAEGGGGGDAAGGGGGGGSAPEFVGTCSGWLDKPNFGFLIRDDKKHDILVNAKGLEATEVTKLFPGHKVKFTEGPGKKGRPIAVVTEIIDEGCPVPKSNPWPKKPKQALEYERRHRGSITKVNDAKDYAIIADDAGGTCLLPGRVLNLQKFDVGDKVTFWAEPGKGGRPCAKKATVLRNEAPGGRACGGRGGGAHNGKGSRSRSKPYDVVAKKGKGKGPHTKRPFGGTYDDETEHSDGGGGGDDGEGNYEAFADAAGARAVMDAMRLRLRADLKLKTSK